MLGLPFIMIVRQMFFLFELTGQTYFHNPETTTLEVLSHSVDFTNFYFCRIYISVVYRKKSNLWIVEIFCVTKKNLGEQVKIRPIFLQFFKLHTSLVFISPMHYNIEVTFLL